jgi:hypothetical protein
MTPRFQISPTAVSSYRRLDYTPWNALAEFIDNARHSFFEHKGELAPVLKADRERFHVCIDFDIGSGKLRISDNAMGMSYSELQHALHVAKPPANTNGRSKYGMGLKTAACWIGNIWTIRTKKLGETVEHRVTIDVEKIAAGSADLDHQEIKDRPALDHFTLIEIDKPNRTFRGRTLGKIKQFLRSMYREDFRNNRLILLWDGEILTWQDDPNRFLLSLDGKPYRRDFSFDVDGKSVNGWVGVLAKGSREEAGFSIIHCGRVVKGWPDSWRPETLYGQFQGTNDLVNQRLVGEIHLDVFEVSHTKDDILWLGDQEDKVQDALREHCGDYRDVAQQYRKKTDDSRGPSQMETDAAVDEFKHELDSPEMVDLIQIEPIPPQQVVEEAFQSVTKSVEETHDETLRGKVGDLTVRLFVVHDMSTNDYYVTVDARKRDEVIVVINQAHPHWGHLKGSDGVLNYLRHCVYDGIAEWQARFKAARLDPDTIKVLKDRLLRLPFEMEKHESTSGSLPMPPTSRITIND